MNFKYIILFSLILIFQGCNSQNSQSHYNADFKWTINFPVGYEELSNDEWLKKVEESGEFIEDSNDIEFENQSIPIFNFKSNSDYFESTKTKFTGTQEDYLNELNEFFQIQTNTIKDQMPNIKIDTKIDTIKISGLDFIHNIMTFEYPNKTRRVLESFNRLFENNNELTINIIYVNNEFGEKFKNSLIKSKFDQ